MKKVSSLFMMMFLLFLFIPMVNANTLDLSSFTAETGAAESSGTITFTESDSPYAWFYFYDEFFEVDSTAVSITFDYSFTIGAYNDDWLVAILDYDDYQFEQGGYNSTAVDEVISGTGTIDLTAYQGSTIDLAFGFEANDWGMDSVGSFSNIQINYNVSSTPEPTTIVLLGLGLLGMAGVGRKMS